MFELGSRKVNLANEFVHSVVVTFHPEETSLLSLLAELGRQTDRVHLIDNTPAPSRVRMMVESACLSNVDVEELGSNFGIAAALNIGIQKALGLGATHVLLSDQDSQPDPRMVLELLLALREVERMGRSVAAVGPSFVDTNTSLTLPFQSDIPGKFFYGHVRPSTNDPIVEVITTITSGMIIPATAVLEVGLMREDLFIDHVDIEWCHRARALGRHIFGSHHAKMSHCMGDEAALRVWFFGWRRESSYPPLRVYYRIRNFVALLKLDYIPIAWKLRNAWTWGGFLYSQVFFGRNKRKSARMAVSGLSDGLRNRMGKYVARSAG